MLSLVSSDRLAAICYLLLTPIAVYATWLMAWDVNEQRPAVTKDPHTGDLYIPRSKLTITGQYTRRHGEG